MQAYDMGDVVGSELVSGVRSRWCFAAGARILRFQTGYLSVKVKNVTGDAAAPWAR